MHWGDSAALAVDRFKDPVAEIFAHIRQAGVVIYEGDGMISFCGPELGHDQPPSPDEPRDPRKPVELIEQLFSKLAN